MTDGMLYAIPLEDADKIIYKQNITGFLIVSRPVCEFVI